MSATIRVRVDEAFIAAEVNSTCHEDRETPDSVALWITSNPERINDMMTDAIIAELAED